MKFSRLLCVCLLASLILGACGEDETPVSQIKVITKTPLIDATNNGATPTQAVTASPTPSPIPADTVLLEIDPSKIGNTISPLIYGLAGSDGNDAGYTTNLKPGLMRWGGNPATRFNWVFGNAWNTGRDLDFRNTNFLETGKDVVGQSIENARKINAAMLITIPTIGWVAKNDEQNIHSLNVPLQGGPALSFGSNAIAGYNPHPNQLLTSVKSEARKNSLFVAKPDPNSPVVYQDEWVASLVKRFGVASAGGVRFYAMDNEPDLWSSTHTDIHPTQMGYDDVLNEFQEYASAVKDVDPSAEITGPVSWGWTGYFWSALDRGTDNYASAADRQKHGSLSFLSWFLDQLRQYEQKNGRRILDVLDIHYYPQEIGVASGAVDAKTAELRLRSTRSLWSNSYVDESWINTQVRLIPRMKEWIDQYYPGTKLGISEWNWGADTTLNGALAISQVLGIFGREGVYLAAYWRNPPANSPGYYAFQMYTNFDGKGSTFGDKSVAVKNSNDGKVTAFAALDSKSGRLRLILINTQPGQSQKVTVQMPKAMSQQSTNLYQLSAATGNKLAAQSPLALPHTNNFQLELPAYSVTLVDLQPPAN